MVLGLPLVAVWWPPAAWGWLGLVGLYALGAVMASLLAAARQGWTLLPLLPLVFASYHFAYGYGFLWGLWDFVILRHGPRRAYTKLTRTLLSN